MSDEPYRVKFYELMIPEFVECAYHGETDPQAYYDDEEIIEQVKEFGRVLCPQCLESIGN